MKHHCHDNIAYKMKIKQEIFVLSNFAFQSDIKEVAIEMQGTGSPSKTFAIIKWTVGVAFYTPWDLNVWFAPT